MTVTRSQALVLLEPKLSNIWFEAYPAFPVEWTKYLNTRSTTKAQVTDFNMTDFGPLVLKSEGGSITYQDPVFGNTVVYTPVRFGGGYKITDEMTKNDLYGQTDRLERGLMKSAIDGQETIAASVMNSAFVTTNSDGFQATGFDSLALCSTAHTRLDGGATQGNRPSTDLDIGVTALQNALIAYDNLLDDRGRPQMIRPNLLIISSGDRFTAKELLQSEYKPGTANNEINALRDEGLSFMVSHYKTDGDAWFVVADKHDANFIWDTQPRTAMQEDFDAEVIKRKIVQGFVVGHGDWRGWYGSTGA